MSYFQYVLTVIFTSWSIRRIQCRGTWRIISSLLGRFCKQQPDMFTSWLQGRHSLVMRHIFQAVVIHLCKQHHQTATQLMHGNSEWTLSITVTGQWYVSEWSVLGQWLVSGVSVNDTVTAAILSQCSQKCYNYALRVLQYRFTSFLDRFVSFNRLICWLVINGIFDTDGV